MVDQRKPDIKIREIDGHFWLQCFIESDGIKSKTHPIKLNDDTQELIRRHSSILIEYHNRKLTEMLKYGLLNQEDQE